MVRSAEGNKKATMATYHLTAKIGQKGKAQPHAEYIAREGKYSDTKSNRYEDLEATASGNMPTWAAHNPAEFWQAADHHERANGSAYREIEIALPRELSPPQRLELVQEFITQEIGKNHAYQFAIHTPKAALEKGEQPHAHIMYSERIRDGIERDPEQYFKRYNAKHPDKGGAKKFSGGKSPSELKAELLALRERWATLQNTHLEKHGHSTRVDHRSLKDQAIERAPEKHLGSVGAKNNAKREALIELRAIQAAQPETIQAQIEAEAIIASHKKQTSALDIAANAAEKLKNKLAERAQAKQAADAEAQRQHQARIEQEKIQAAQNKQAEPEATKPQKKTKSIDHEAGL